MGGEDSTTERLEGNPSRWEGKGRERSGWFLAVMMETVTHILYLCLSHTTVITSIKDVRCDLMHAPQGQHPPGWSNQKRSSGRYCVTIEGHYTRCGNRVSFTAVLRDVQHGVQEKVGCDRAVGAGYEYQGCIG